MLDEDLAESLQDLSDSDLGLHGFGTLEGSGSHGFGTHGSPMHGGKPIIYFHPGPTFDPNTNIRVAVSIADGQIHEAWPTSGALDGESLYRWESIQIQPNTPCDGSGAPSYESEYCTRLGSPICEAAELHAYMDDVPHCLSVHADGQRSPVLLYNGYLPNAQAPATFDGSELTTGEYGVGTVWINHEGTLSRFDRLGPNVTVQVGLGPQIDTHDALLADIQAELQELGLTEQEARHFVEA